MAGNQTSNYHLNQWEPEDKVLRADFNADNQRIDAALGALAEKVPKIAAGHYTGNGEASRTINLGFRPKAVILCTNWGETAYYELGKYYGYGGMALDGRPARLVYSNTAVDFITITATGFQVVYQDLSSVKAYSNYNKTGYHYIAIG